MRIEGVLEVRLVALLKGSSLRNFYGDRFELTSQAYTAQVDGGTERLPVAENQGQVVACGRG